MESSVLAALALTLGADKDTRQQAEIALAQAEATPGIYEVLSRLAVRSSELPIQQAAVLYLKNSCKAWTQEARAKLGKAALSPTDQLYLRTNIIQFLHPGLPPLVRAQFVKVAKRIAKSVPLREWTEVLPQLDSALAGQELAAFYAGLTLIYQIFKVVSKRLSTQRKPELGLLSERYCGYLLDWFQRLPFTADTLPCYEILLKVYFRATFIEYLGLFGHVDNFKSWQSRILSVLSTELGAAGWALKKWSLRIAHRCISREISLASMSADLKSVTQHFLQDCSQHYAVQARAQLLVSEAPESVKHFSWKYLAQAARSTWKETQVYAHSIAKELLGTALLPQVCRVPDEELLWANSPAEFLHRENDFLMTASSAKFAALDFLLALCSSGQLEVALAFIAHILEQDPLSPLLKEAALLMLGSLSSLEPLRTTYRTSISTNLHRYALPELHNSIGFLRFRAVWLYGRFASCIQEEEHQLTVLPQICKLLLDSDLPVRVQASTTLSKVLGWSGSARLLEPEISNLLEVFKANMELVDSEDLIDALEDLVDHYSTQVVPYAFVLAQKLCTTFTRTAHQEDKMTALPVLSVLIKLTSALKDHPEDLYSVSQQLLPILQFTLSPQGETFAEEGLTLLGNLVGLLDSSRISHLYVLVPLLTLGLTGQGEVPAYASEYYEQSFNSLANFIAKDKAAFLGVEGVLKVLSVAKHYLALDEDNVGYEYHFAAKLLICLCENYPDICTAYADSLRQAIRFLVSKNERAWKLQAIQLLSVLLANDVTGTLAWLGADGDTVFKYWFDNLNQFKAKPAKAHIALSFIALLRCSDQLTELLTRNLPTILRNLLQLLGDLSKEEGEEDSEEEDDTWAPIEEDLYESPVTLPVLVQLLRPVMSALQGGRPLAWQAIEAELQPGEKDTLAGLLGGR